VYQVHDWAEVRELARQGMAKQRIAARLGVSRGTVYRLLALREPPRYEQAAAASLLDPFKGEIEQLLSDDHAAAATVILERLRARGYAGGITILKEHLRELRPRFAPSDCFGRTVYVPGEILQADWWDTGVSVPVGKGASRRAYGMVTKVHSDPYATDWPRSACEACAPYEHSNRAMEPVSQPLVEAWSELRAQLPTDDRPRMGF